MPQAPPQKFLRCLAILTCVAAFAACATQPVAAGTRYVVSVRNASFYKYGPAQSFGPDFALSQGTKVTMLKKSFGFSHVKTEDGIDGYVASEEVKPAPHEPSSVKPSVAGSRSSPASSRSKRSNVGPTPGSPPLDMSDLPLPLPENSEPPKPAPRFKF
jgi:hypothetical protein